MADGLRVGCPLLLPASSHHVLLMDNRRAHPQIGRARTGVDAEVGSMGACNRVDFYWVRSSSAVCLLHIS